VTAIDIDTLDLTDRKATFEYVANGGFDAVINCAAMTNVDACETNREAAISANAFGAGNLAAAAAAIGAKIIHVSTDYVFSGDAKEPYSEWDVPAPVSAYGKSKLLGENYVRAENPKSFIVRTSWLYGYVGNNFVRTMLRLASENPEITVVNDQFGNPTHANDLAHHMLKLITTEAYGYYHCTGEGICSWYDFASEIIRLSGLDCTVKPCGSDEYPSPTVRPAYSAMDNLALRATVGNEMRDWKEAIAAFMEKDRA
jgi:dTDP-4-dehydrorhamnose reductase